ncbi:MULTISPECIES: glycosyltransferase family 2 protein [unclassified Marinobacter]|uniref:glycosyltransferase family 2 protein n=1 Tax=unclassified Marinobacter TaxID=83889 RepID=UPI00200D01D5|nr:MULTISPECIES: glycosyltransferase family 2 protein [unclassified Marinobacter]UQG57007.1 glycosyltransferase family 2 protein [Marinobacter sp. M4C]UQG65811.1 glycosyltransferase family 2 protein [Marinobacter sp. M2C]UQG70091.1 glycosyltransferase family 2 protein [Marinobacter sp. M1C]
MEASVVIPAKNEFRSLPSLIEKLLALPGLKEIIVVDDGSTDGTGDIAEKLGASVIRHPYSKGNGAAIKSGARAATGDIILFMDADGQHSPDDVHRLLNKLDQGFDMVVGARQSGSQASVGRGLANKFYNWFASYMTGQKIEDLTSGFRAVRRVKFLQFLSLLPNGFSYPTTSTMAFFRAGYSVCYEPIHTGQREGKSHIKPIQDGVRFLLIIFKIGTLYSPLKLFFPLAFSIFSLGIGYYAYTYFALGRFTNMSALMFTTALTIFMVGLVSEQITTLMYREK